MKDTPSIFWIWYSPTWLMKIKEFCYFLHWSNTVMSNRDIPTLNERVTCACDMRMTKMNIQINNNYLLGHRLQDTLNGFGMKDWHLATYCRTYSLDLWWVRTSTHPTTLLPHNHQNTGKFNTRCISQHTYTYFTWCQ